MKQNHLFREHPHAHVEPGETAWDPDATKAQLTDDEISQIRTELIDGGGSAACPRCAAAMNVEVLESLDDDERTWSATCPVCVAHVNVRVFTRGPRAPAFDNLIVSAPNENRLREFLPKSTLSALVHVVLIYLAVIATQAGAAVVQAVPDTALVYLTIDAQDEEKPEPEEQDRPAQIVTLNPAPKGFQTIDAPMDIPTDIPPIDLTQRFDPRDFSGVGVEGGIFEGVEGGTGPIPANLATHTFLEAAVDEPPERIAGPPLVYPEVMRQANIEGMVIFEFIVDTKGGVESNSLKVIRASHEAFVRPAREVIVKSTFRPGRVRGVPVRVLVRQAVAFDILSR